MADCRPHRGGDRAHLRRRAASLRHRRLHRPRQVAGGQRRPGAAGGPARTLLLAVRTLPVLGAGTLHLHVHLDGEVRRRLRRADGHPRRRGRAGQPAVAGLAQIRDPLQPAVRRAVHRHCRRVRRPLRRRDVSHRPAVERPRSTDVDRLPDAAAGLGADVLPHHDVAHVEGMADALHPAETGPVEARGGLTPLGTILILTPLLIVAVCVAHATGLVVLPQSLRAVIVFALLLALMLTGMPVSIALGLTVLAFMFTLTDVRTESVALKLFTGLESFEIMAVPFFILAGNFLTHGGVARRMINFATAMVGHWYGGLALSGVLACALFAAVSGSSPATVVAIGSVILPAMVAQGFPKRFGAGVITTSGSLGILIPPSIPMVLYAVATNSSVGKLFIAGILPGIVMATMLGMTTFYRAWRNDYPRLPKASFGERVRTFRESIWGLFLIVIVIGGIYTGLFTPTEAAAMSAVYAFFIAVFVYKDLKLSDVPRVLLSSANLSAMILYIITNAVLFSFLMTYENIPQDRK